MTKTEGRAYAPLPHVLGYARQGLAVLSLQPRSKIPFGPHPCPRPHDHGLLDATRDPAAVNVWWTMHPEANIAFATGRGIDVLDVDGPEGEASLAALVARRWTLPETTIARTGRGRQLYFRAAGWPCTAGRLGPGLDTRGRGGYVVMPPSVHPSGVAYSWLVSGPLAPAPAWLTQLLLRPVVAAPVIRRAVAHPSKYAAAALSDAVRTVSSAPEGVRNVTLNTEAFGIGQLVAAGALGEAHAEDALVAAAVSAGLPEGEARRTVGSAFRGGAAKPRSAP